MAHESFLIFQSFFLLDINSTEIFLLYSTMTMRPKEIGDNDITNISIIIHVSLNTEILWKLSRLLSCKFFKQIPPDLDESFSFFDDDEFDHGKHKNCGFFIKSTIKIFYSLWSLKETKDGQQNKNILHNSNVTLNKLLLEHERTSEKSPRSFVIPTTCRFDLFQSPFCMCCVGLR